MKILIYILFPVIVLGQTISGATGTIAHDSTLVISGSSFGAKSTAAPLVWDDCSGSDPATLWESDYWPASYANANYRLDYRDSSTIDRGVGPAHSNVSQYLCGSHYGDNGYDEGWNVAFWKTLSGWTWPTDYFFSFWHRVDPNWNLSGDDNHKWFGYSSGGSIYELPYNWYLESVGGMASGYNTHLNDDCDCVVGWTGDGWSAWYGDDFPNHPMSQWVKVEIQITADANGGGKVVVWADGIVVINLQNDDTDGIDYGAEGTNRTIGLGGFARIYDTNNWRYWNDIYLDNSYARVVLGDSATWNACLVREMQIPTAWAAGEITVTVNEGVFNTDDTAYLYVLDSDGTVSSGYDVTIGATLSESSSGTITIGNGKITVGLGRIE